MQRTGLPTVWLVTDEFDIRSLETPLPNIQEVFDNLILWIGNAQGTSAGRRVPLDTDAAAAWIGLSLKEDARKFFGWLLRDENFGRLVDHDAPTSAPEILICSIRLTTAGWARFDTLTRQRVDSRIGFMALQFGDAELDALVNDHFRGAVGRAGFELRVLTDRQPAGLIDDQLRVALRRAKFVIADLTHGNNGAYWEAGFAEGLGRPVIYTCRQREWHEGNQKTHFDTNHLVTIIWDPDQPDMAAKKLTATIRATLPDEATFDD